MRGQRRNNRGYCQKEICRPGIHVSIYRYLNRHYLVVSQGSNFLKEIVFYADRYSFIYEYRHLHRDVDVTKHKSDLHWRDIHITCMSELIALTQRPNKSLDKRDYLGESEIMSIKLCCDPSQNKWGVKTEVLEEEKGNYPQVIMKHPFIWDCEAHECQHSTKCIQWASNTLSVEPHSLWIFLKIRLMTTRKGVEQA